MCTPSHRHNFRFLVNTTSAEEESVVVVADDDDDDDDDACCCASNNSSMVCRVRPHAAPAFPVSLWMGHDTTKPQTLFSRTRSDNRLLDESGIFRLPFLLIGMLKVEGCCA